MIDYAAIGKRIQKKRQERSITQEKLAEQVGISVVYLSKIENGRSTRRWRPFPTSAQSWTRSWRGAVQHGNGAERLRQ